MQWIHAGLSCNVLPCINFTVFLSRFNHVRTNKGFLLSVTANMVVNAILYLIRKFFMFSSFPHSRKTLYQRLPRFTPVVPFPYLNVGPVSKQVATASPGGPALISRGQISAIGSCHLFTSEGILLPGLHQPIATQ